MRRLPDAASATSFGSASMPASDSRSLSETSRWRSERPSGASDSRLLSWLFASTSVRSRFGGGPFQSTATMWLSDASSERSSGTPSKLAESSRARWFEPAIRWTSKPSPSTSRSWSTRSSPSTPASASGSRASSTETGGSSLLSAPRPSTSAGIACSWHVRRSSERQTEERLSSQDVGVDGRRSKGCAMAGASSLESSSSSSYSLSYSESDIATETEDKESARTVEESRRSRPQRSSRPRRPPRV